MILRFLPGTGEDVVQELKLILESAGIATIRSGETERPILAAIGKLPATLRKDLERHPAIEERIPARGEQLLAMQRAAGAVTLRLARLDCRKGLGVSCEALGFVGWKQGERVHAETQIAAHNL